MWVPQVCDTLDEEVDVIHQQRDVIGGVLGTDDVCLGTPLVHRLQLAANEGNLPHRTFNVTNERYMRILLMPMSATHECGRNLRPLSVHTNLDDKR